MIQQKILKVLKIQTKLIFHCKMSIFSINLLNGLSIKRIFTPERCVQLFWIRQNKSFYLLKLDINRSKDSAQD